MSTERAFIVRLSPNQDGVAALVADMAASHRRIPKALPGDRAEIVRYEALSTQLEAIARTTLQRVEATVIEIAAVDRDGSSIVDTAGMEHLPDVARQIAEWTEAGDIAVEIRSSLNNGPTAHLGRGVVLPAAKAWKSPVDDLGHQLSGTRAVAERFKQQLRNAVDGATGAAILPSGVSNRVLTEGLRTAVNDDFGPACSAKVAYRDGSQGPNFPLCCVSLVDQAPTGWQTYHLSMLSIRHAEMDMEVDGAWLRNTDISRPRPAGDTDRIVYELSRSQFDSICVTTPVLIYLYQTGLDTAIVGFYRAVTDRLARYPGSLAVVPMYFRRQPPSESQRSVGGYQQQTTFEEGKVWATPTQQ